MPISNAGQFGTRHGEEIRSEMRYENDHISYGPDP